VAIKCEQGIWEVLFDGMATYFEMIDLALAKWRANRQQRVCVFLGKELGKIIWDSTEWKECEL